MLPLHGAFGRRRVMAHRFSVAWRSLLTQDAGCCGVAIGCAFFSAAARGWSAQTPAVCVEQQGAAHPGVRPESDGCPRWRGGRRGAPGPCPSPGVSVSRGCGLGCGGQPQPARPGFLCGRSRSTCFTGLLPPRLHLPSCPCERASPGGHFTGKLRRTA